MCPDVLIDVITTNSCSESQLKGTHSNVSPQFYSTSEVCQHYDNMSEYSIFVSQHSRLLMFTTKDVAEWVTTVTMVFSLCMPCMCVYVRVCVCVHVYVSVCLFVHACVRVSVQVLVYDILCIWRCLFFIFISLFLNLYSMEQRNR